MTVTQSRKATTFILLLIATNMYYASNHMNLILNLLTAGCAMVSELYYQWVKKI